MIEQKMIDRLKKKDEAAFEYVYEKTKRGVYSVIYAVVKNHVTTEDLMQDVYMKMMHKLDSYQDHTNFYNWLLLMSKNQAIDYYRKNKKEVLIDVVDYNEMTKSMENTPDETDKFNQMLNILSDDLKEIVLLRIVDQMKFKDIAKLQKKPLSTVIWEYQQALRALRKYEGFS